jgi:hypothetical protein
MPHLTAEEAAIAQKQHDPVNESRHSDLFGAEQQQMLQLQQDLLPRHLSEGLQSST